jgi:DNA-binding NarL/FixJ family response regulator
LLENGRLHPTVAGDQTCANRAVLIADHSEIVRGLVRSLLEQFANVEICVETANARDTIDSALRLKIVDVIMPELNGIEATSVLKQNLLSTKVILFTMFGESVKSLARQVGLFFPLLSPIPG